MSYLVTGDVTARLEGVDGPALYGEPLRNVDETEAARAARLLAAERRRAQECPIPNPWDAWRDEKAPPMFEPEVTHRG